MATNKHATIRYHALDRCFSNHLRRFYIEDLILACNEAIYEYSGLKDGVKRRQVFEDITFMESEQGWSLPLERIKDGKRVYYRYSDKSFSIKNRNINQSEAEQIKETLNILSRYKGLPHFEWVEEIQVRLEDTFKLKGNMEAIVGFEHNPYLKGLNYFTELFNAIRNKKTLIIRYQGYRQESASLIIISPWYLKQYNNRWFLFGFNTEYQALSNLAIDRIQSIEESRETYVVNNKIDFEEYFEDIVGVSVKEGAAIQKIVIKITGMVWPYIESKPLHGSQKVIRKNDSNVEIELRVQVNHEFMALLFSYMDAIEIIEPESLRERFRTISEKILKINI